MKHYNGNLIPNIPVDRSFDHTCELCQEVETWLLQFRSAQYGYANFKLSAIKPACNKGNYWFAVRTDKQHGQRRMVVSKHDAHLLRTKRPTLFNLVNVYMEEQYA